jgi:hypothetical protein
MLRLCMIVIAAGCQQPDDAEVVQPLESTLGAAVPTAYFATIAMQSLEGRPSPCANVVSPTGSSQVRVDVSLGASCPPMFSRDEQGVVVVTGTWAPPIATFVMDFVGVTEGGAGMLVVGIGAMTVTTNGAHYVIAYGEEDILIASGQQVGAGIDQIAWVVDVDTKTTDDVADDVITVSGGDQSLLAASGDHPEADITQVAVGNAVFNAGCRKNPNTGLAAVQRAGTRGGGWLLYAFHSTCDGTTDVTAAMAPYELMLGKKVELVFLQQ